MMGWGFDGRTFLVLVLVTATAEYAKDASHHDEEEDDFKKRLHVVQEAC